MASKAIPTILQIAGLHCCRRAFEISSGVVIDHRSFHRKIDRTNWNRAKEGSKQVVKGSIRAYSVSSRRLLVSLSLELEQHGILTITCE